jgi:hypothetical protein
VFSEAEGDRGLHWARRPYMCVNGGSTKNHPRRHSGIFQPFNLASVTAALRKRNEGSVTFSAAQLCWTRLEGSVPGSPVPLVPPPLCLARRGIPY